MTEKYSLQEINPNSIISAMPLQNWPQYSFLASIFSLPPLQNGLNHSGLVIIAKTCHAVHTSEPLAILALPSLSLNMNILISRYTQITPIL